MNNDIRDNKIERIRGLTAVLNEASLIYYQRGGQLMSDLEYDRLADELERLENETGFSLPDSPSRRIGHEVVSSLEKVVHKTPMMSLDKTKDETKLPDFLNGMEGILSWKLDGLAIELTYKGGVLERAVTRGNGLIGENITHNARNFINLPKRIDFSGELSVRGEAVITFEDFEKINASLEGESKYKNPRNLCSGTVRQLDSRAAKERSVHFFAYSIAGDMPDTAEFSKRADALKFLDEAGFDVVTYKIVTEDNIIEAVSHFREHISENPFATDGLVAAFNDLEYGRSLGVTSKFPKDSLAFKWADEEAETTLLDVEWSTSRTGLINPVAVFEPVDIEGTSVERASLHNLSIFESLKPGAGDRILVYKANMIIPQLSTNLTMSGTLSHPGQCPVCGHRSEIEDNNGTKQLYCVNPNCTARAVRTIAHYTSRDAMNIEGLSEQTVSKLHELGFLNNFTDLYTLTVHQEEIVKIKGFGKQSFNKLIAAIERSKDCYLHNFIYALGIRNVGLVNAKTLCAHYDGSLDAILGAPGEELQDLPGFGSVIAGSLRDYFADGENSALINKAAAFLNFIPVPHVQGGRLTGKIFVITGDLNSFKNRAELQALIEKEGGKVTGSVSAKTTYLINNKIQSGSSKNVAARSLGVTIITEQDFIGLLRTE